MKQKYRKFILNNCCDNPVVARGQCKIASKNIAFIFPELKVLKGFVEGYNKKSNKIERYNHWWNEDENGEIVDVTISQFNELKDIKYILAIE